LEVSKSHSDMQHPVRLLRTGDQSVAGTPTYTAHNKHKKQTYMPPVGFEPTIPASARPKAHALDCAATGIGTCFIQPVKFNVSHLDLK
jgi:hypothetical protein